MRAWWTVAVVVALGGCGKEATEGSNPGECTDAADNDADGFFDCDDNGCWGAPTCAGAGTTDTDGVPVGGNVDTDDDTTPTGDETDVDTEPPEVSGDGVNARLKSVSLTYQLDVSWDAAGEITCNSYFDTTTGQCDCTSIYHGSGVLVDLGEKRNRFQGRFELVSSNCARAPESHGSIASGMSINEASVYTSQNGEMFHTFVFSSDGSQGVNWVTHEDADNDTPCRTFGCPSANELGHFWIIFNQPHPNLAASLNYTTTGTSPQGVSPMPYYEEIGPYYIADQGITMNLVHHLAVQFSETYDVPDYPSTDLWAPAP